MLLNRKGEEGYALEAIIRPVVIIVFILLVLYLILKRIAPGVFG